MERRSVEIINHQALLIPIDSETIAAWRVLLAAGQLVQILE
ncbi:hypothetical protein [Nitrosococcus watsonii]|nr:hypothetical protein [Nitrosococcus watsonii]